MELKDVKRKTLYTTAQVAEFMGVSEVSVSRYVREGMMEAFDISEPNSQRPIYRIEAKAVQAYYDRIEARKVVKKKVEDFGAGL